MLSWARPSLALNLKCLVRGDNEIIWSLSPEICDMKDLLTADNRRRYKKGDSKNFFRNTCNLRIRLWALLHFNSSCPWCSFISSSFQSFFPAFSGFCNSNGKYFFEMSQFMCCTHFCANRKGCSDTMMLNEIPVDPIWILQGGAAMLSRNRGTWFSHFLYQEHHQVRKYTTKKKIVIFTSFHLENTYIFSKNICIFSNLHFQTIVPGEKKKVFNVLLLFTLFSV